MIFEKINANTMRVVSYFGDVKHLDYLREEILYSDEFEELETKKYYVKYYMGIITELKEIPQDVLESVLNDELNHVIIINGCYFYR